MSEEQALARVREKIDALDEEIQSLINARAAAAAEVAEIKQASGEEPLYYRPEREAQVLRRIMERNQGPLGDEEITAARSELGWNSPPFEVPSDIAAAWDGRARGAADEAALGVISMRAAGRRQEDDLRAVGIDGYRQA